MSETIKTSNVKMIDELFDMFRTPNNPELMIKKIPTGLSGLDRILGGGLTNGVHTLCAQPGAGKTTFALNIAMNVAINGMPAMIFSYEMPRDDLVTKMYSRISSELSQTGGGFSFDDIRTERKMTASEFKLYAKTADFAETNLRGRIAFLDGIKHKYKIGEIVDEIEMFVSEKQQAPLVIIDYLQMIAPENESISLKSNIEYAMSELHNIAEKHHLPVIAISAIAKQGADTLSLFSGAESARIAYGSVTHWGLTDETADSDAAYKTVRLDIFKNRYGRSGAKMKFSFDGEHSRFTEFAEAKPQKAKGKK
jgi:replicative DNA helicase